MHSLHKKNSGKHSGIPENMPKNSEIPEFQYWFGIAITNYKAPYNVRCSYSAKNVRKDVIDCFFLFALVFADVMSPILINEHMNESDWALWSQQKLTKLCYWFGKTEFQPSDWTEHLRTTSDPVITRWTLFTSACDATLDSPLLWKPTQAARDISVRLGP